MKRIFACIIAFVMIFPLMTACNNADGNENSQNNGTSSSVVNLQEQDNPQGGDSSQGDKNSHVDNEFLVGHIQISSGANTISPFGCLLRSVIDNGDGTYTESKVDKYDVVDLVSDKTEFSETDIPTLVLDEKVTYLVQANGSVEKVYLITPNGNEYIKSDTTFDDLTNLNQGTYYVVVEVLLGGNCDPDAPQNSYYYEDVFCLIVGEP